MRQVSFERWCQRLVDYNIAKRVDKFWIIPIGKRHMIVICRERKCLNH